jgi:hypothetical protein
VWSSRSGRGDAVLSALAVMTAWGLGCVKTILEAALTQD